MDVKEKLVELQSIITCPNAICNFCEYFKNKSACEKHKKEVIADNMIANGVPVQERISVEDRLPEDDSDVIAYLRTGEEGRIFPANYAKGVWFDCIFNKRVTETTTHWMPIPQPPKGE